MMPAASGITCVGILCADVLGKTVDNLPQKGKLNLVDNISLQIGGCAANVAISLAKLGVNTSLVGKVGDDSLGKFLINTLQSENVGVKGLKVDKNVSTSASMVMISGDSERSIIHALGANKEFCYEDIDVDILKETTILLIAGTFLMPGFDGTGTEKLLKTAKENNILCCMDTAWDASGEWMNKVKSSLQYLDWFMPSYDEACELTGKTIPSEIAGIFNAKGVRNVIIKLNSEGCFVKPQNEEGYIVPSFTRIQPVDTSGAGDAFCAGFITGLDQGWPIRQCAEFANAVGVHCIMQIGTTAGIKSMNEILRFMENYEAGVVPVC
ncbi:MAG: carbohydrate kinase family protein [Ferruginibacter sp.]